MDQTEIREFAQQTNIVPYNPELPYLSSASRGLKDDVCSHALLRSIHEKMLKNFSNI
jgi:hypothetical protein